MRLYYSISDSYPAYRADIGELFGVELTKLGVNTEWFMAASSLKTGSINYYTGQTIHRPNSLISSIYFLSKVQYFLTDIIHMILLIFRKVDAIQCRDKYISSFFAIFIARLKGIPFFYWCSFPFPEYDQLSANTLTGFPRFIGRIKAFIRFKFLYLFICHFSDHIFVQSQRMKENMNSYGIPLDLMTAVPMGVSARITDWISENPIKVNPLRLLYLGTLGSVRHLEVILDAVLLVQMKIPNVEILFVGDGDHPSERLALEKKSVELGLQNNVSFTGFVPTEEAWALTASAAVCLSPFYPTPVLESASPTKLLEYMALGRPVVCNEHPEQSEIISMSGAGLCVEWSAPAFADAILQLLNDPIASELMAKQGPPWISKFRMYPSIAKIVLNKYRNFVP